MRKLGSAFLLIGVLSANALAQPAVVHSSAIPEPGQLALLGGGLFGLAALIRRHLSN